MKSFVTLLAALCVSGCLIVEDFGNKWEEATPDACLNRIADSLYYQTFQRSLEKGEIAAHTRGLAIEELRFLLLKKDPADTGGNLYRFEVENGVYAQFRLNPAMREQFAEEYPNAPVRIERDTVVLPKLDEKTVTLLLAVARDARYWEKKDAHLYNPLRNPNCPFEDRDLTTLD